MPTKHIDEETWKKIEQITIEEVIKQQKMIKPTEMLKRLILLGIKEYKENKESGK